MKAFFNNLGWILFLALAVVFLVFFNFGYAPKADRIVRQQHEIAMWTDHVAELTDSLRMVRAQWDTVFDASFTCDRLFGGADGFQVTPQGDSALRAIIPTLQTLTGKVEVIGHSDNSPVPQRLKDRYPGNWEYAGAQAGAVARALVLRGVKPGRVLVLSAPEGRASNRRVEILVRNVPAEGASAK